MNIQEHIVSRKPPIELQAIEFAKKFVENVGDAIQAIVDSDIIFESKWIMVYIAPEDYYVEIRTAIRDYQLLKTELDKEISLFDREIMGEEQSGSVPFCFMYTPLVLEKMCDFLKEQGFVNIGPKLPVDKGGVRPNDEMFRWYALRI